jgi:hypothetical protein
MSVNDTKPPRPYRRRTVKFSVTSEEHQRVLREALTCFEHAPIRARKRTVVSRLLRRLNAAIEVREEKRHAR